MMLEKAAATTGSRVTSLVRAILAQGGGAADPAPDDRLVDAGLTSVDMVNLMLAVETEFDVLIPPAEITPANFRSIASITALVHRVLDGAA